MDAELVWSGKYAADGTRRSAPRVVRPLTLMEGPGGAPSRLVLGDNLEVMASLESELSGKVDLVYIDPPFATGVSRGDYGDRWPTGAYLSMLSDRIELIHALLSERGSLVVHVDWRAAAHVRLLLDERFGAQSFRSEIVWHYQSGGRARAHYPRKHDTLLWYARGAEPWFRAEGCSEPRGVCPQCGTAREKWNNLKREVDDDGRVYRTIRSAGRLYRYYDDEPTLASDVWLGISHLQQKDPERTGWATQKPERLLARIVETHSPPGGLVADVFCGSGTTLAVAERLGRRWLGCDLEPRAIDTAARRLRQIEGSQPFDVMCCTGS